MNSKLFKVIRIVYKKILSNQKNTTIFIISIIFILHLPFFFPIKSGFFCDEASFIYTGMRISKGDVLYKDVMMDKPPAFFFLFALFISLFGEHFFMIRVMTALFNAITSVFIYFIGKKLFDHKVGFYAGILYGFSAVSPQIGGYYGIGEPYMVFFSTAAILLFLRKKNDTKVLMFSGFLIGFSFLMKQPGGLTGIFLVLVILLNMNYTFIKKIKDILFMISGGIISLVPFILYFWYEGNLDEAIRWSFTAYLGLETWVSPYERMKVIYNIIIYLSLMFSLVFIYLVWIMVKGYGIFANATIDKSSNRKLQDLKEIYTLIGDHTPHIFVFLWFVLTLLFLLKSTDIYGHYFLQIMPPCTLMAGWTLRKLFKYTIKPDFQTAGILLTVIFLTTLNFGGYIYKSAENTIFSNENDLVEVSTYIKNHTIETDTIQTFSGSAIYLLSERKAASAYFVLMLNTGENARSEDEMNKIFINDFEKNRPKYIIPNSIYTRPRYNQTLTYIYQHYHLEITINNMDLYRINE